MRLFLDTNVIIAASLAGHSHHSRALPVLESVHRKENTGFVSSHTLLELYATLTRLPRSPRLLPQQVTTLIEANVLDHFTAVAFGANEYIALLKSLGENSTTGAQAYDALHLACATKCEADNFYTFNVRHFETLATSVFKGKIVAP